MRTWLVAFVLFLIAAAAAVTLYIEQKRRIHVALATLVAESTNSDHDHSSRFFMALSDLNVKPTREIYRGHGVKIQNHVLVVLYGYMGGRGGGSGREQLLLFDRHGQLLDELSCDVDFGSRIWEFAIDNCISINFDAKIEKADVSFRFAIEPWGTGKLKWPHNITHRNKTRSFRWEYSQIERAEGTLCRARVTDAGFKVVYDRDGRDCPGLPAQSGPGCRAEPVDSSRKGSCPAGWLPTTLSASPGTERGLGQVAGPAPGTGFSGSRAGDAESNCTARGNAVWSAPSL